MPRTFLDLGKVPRPDDRSVLELNENDRNFTIGHVSRTFPVL